MLELINDGLLRHEAIFFEFLLLIRLARGVELIIGSISVQTTFLNRPLLVYLSTPLD